MHFFSISRMYWWKQPPRGIPGKRCFENMQQICRRTPMPKCDFYQVALQLYWNHTSAWVLCNFIEITLRHGCSSVHLLDIFRTPFPGNTSGWLLLYWNILARLFISAHNFFWHILKSNLILLRTSGTKFIHSIC